KKDMKTIKLIITVLFGLVFGSCQKEAPPTKEQTKKTDTYTITVIATPSENQFKNSVDEDTVGLTIRISGIVVAERVDTITTGDVLQISFEMVSYEQYTFLIETNKPAYFSVTTGKNDKPFYKKRSNSCASTYYFESGGKGI